MRRVAVLLAAAVLPVLALVALHALGLRADVGALSGTVPADELRLAGGLLYVLAWVGAVMVTPIVVVASLVSALTGGAGAPRGDAPYDEACSPSSSSSARS